MTADQGPQPGTGLGRPELARLWDELARRWSEGTDPVTVTIRGLTSDEQAALADLLGADRLPGPNLRLSVTRLAAALGVDGTAGVRAVTEELRGPIPDRAASRRAREASRAELWEWLDTEVTGIPLFEGCPDAAARWTASMRSAGIPGGDVAAGRRRLEAVLGSLRALPAAGVPLAGFAADRAGGPHALDRGRWAAAAVLGAVSLAGNQEPPSDAESARRLWESVGVAPDPLSSTVLVFGLQPPGADPVAAHLRATSAAGEAAVLTLAQLRRWPLPPLAPSECVYVVENPSLVADAVARHDARGAPLVCSSGRPTVAVVTALRQLGAAGAPLHQHADFDPAGLAITAWLAARAGTVPWRMTAAEYRAATRPGRTPRPMALPETPWDPALATAMTQHGVAVYEEDIRTPLLEAMGYGQASAAR